MLFAIRVLTGGVFSRGRYRKIFNITSFIASASYRLKKSDTNKELDILFQIIVRLILIFFFVQGNLLYKASRFKGSFCQEILR